MTQKDKILDITKYCERDSELTLDGYKVVEVYDDIIVAKYEDETEDSSGEIVRNGIVLKADNGKKLWRVGSIVMKGPNVSDQFKIGDLIFFPNDMGMPAFNIAEIKSKCVFINEQRIFGKVKPG